MLIGKIIQLVHLSQQSPLRGVRLVSEHNDHGYGVLRDDAGREVFFSHEVVAGPRGFDDLRRGQAVEFTLDDPFLRAASLQSVAEQGQLAPAAT
jgi:cold shock CspA family protein